MKSKVARFPASPDATYGRQARAVESVAEKAEDAVSTEEADVRLVIEHDPATGTYVYKTVDRRTGEVLQRLRREEVLRMRGETGYHAGEVIRTKA